MFSGDVMYHISLSVLWTKTNRVKSNTKMINLFKYFGHFISSIWNKRVLSQFPPESVGNIMKVEAYILFVHNQLPKNTSSSFKSWWHFLFNSISSCNKTMWFTVCLIALLVIWIVHLLFTWGNLKRNGRLPPGTTGYPFIGETIQFFAPYTLYDIPPFVKKRVERYDFVNNFKVFEFSNLWRIKFWTKLYID